jgi:hypothetical protein
MMDFPAAHSHVNKHPNRSKQSLISLIMSILAIGSLSTTNIAIAQSIDSSSQVTVSIYSGRNDPTWRLSAADTNRLIAQIQRLKSIPTHKFIQRLGVEDWLVRIGSTTDLIIAERGFIEYRQQGKSRFFHDPTFTIENQLLQSGKNTLTPTDEHYRLIRSASIPIFKMPNKK